MERVVLWTETQQIKANIVLRLLYRPKGSFMRRVSVVFTAHRAVLMWSEIITSTKEDVFPGTARIPAMPGWRMGHGPK